MVSWALRRRWRYKRSSALSRVISHRAPWAKAHSRNFWSSGSRHSGSWVRWRQPSSGWGSTVTHWSKEWAAAVADRSASLANRASVACHSPTSGGEAIGSMACVAIASCSRVRRGSSNHQSANAVLVSSTTRGVGSSKQGARFRGGPSRSFPAPLQSLAAGQQQDRAPALWWHLESASTRSNGSTRNRGAGWLQLATHQGFPATV